MSIRGVWIWLLILATGTYGLAPGEGVAQERTGVVQGRAVDPVTGPVNGARVQVTGTNLSVLTNAEGQYRIAGVPVGSVQVRIVHLGYQAAVAEATVVAGQVVNLDFELRQMPYSLEGIVVTATGERLTRELGHAVSTIDAAALSEVAPITSLAELLSSRAPGVTVLQQSGAAGGAARIRVRGLSSATLSNDPVVYVDGVRVEQSNTTFSGLLYSGGNGASFLNSLNPEDIEDIEVVKGPSAATLYGTQAANGVIRITTRRGRVGETRWNVYSEQGIRQDVSDYPVIYFSEGTNNATGARQHCIPADAARGLCTIRALHQWDPWSDPDQSPIRTGLHRSYGLRVSGGSEAVRFMVSGDWMDQQGTFHMPGAEQAAMREQRGISTIPQEQLRPNDYVRGGLRSNLDFFLNPRTDLAVSMSYSGSRQGVPYSGDGGADIIGSITAGTADPLAALPFGFVRTADAFSRPVRREEDRFLQSLSMNFRPTTFLSTRATLGLDHVGFKDEATQNRGEGCTWCNGGRNRQGLRVLNRHQVQRWTADLIGTATFNLTPAVSGRTSVGAQYLRHVSEASLNSANIFPPGGASIDAGTVRASGEFTDESVTLGTFVEQQVGFAERLYLTGAIRVDQNSAFGEDTRTALYPKLGASYVALERGDGILPELRLRASYGQSGLHPAPNAAARYYVPVEATLYGGASQPAVTLGSVGNPDLKPERSREYELGADATLLDGRANLQLTVYDKRTTDALVNRLLPGSLGATASRTENLGEVSNRGIETALSGRVLSGNTSLDLTLTASGNRNRLETLGDGVPPVYGFGWGHVPGHPLFGLWDRALTSFSDRNGDGIITPDELEISDDRIYAGSSVPTREVTFTTNLSRGPWQVLSVWNYRGGGGTMNASFHFGCSFRRNCYDINSPDAPLEAQAKALAGQAAFGSYFESTDFLKLRELGISWTAPASVSRALRASSTQVTLSGRNLLTFSSFPGWDPELTTSANDDSAYSFNAVGLTRNITLRLNLGF